MEKSRVRITCDPFKKEIKYEWYASDGERYEPMHQNSKLWSDEYVNATIQNRAHEIVQIINEECNSGNLGLEIYFTGTERDYADLCNVINTYYGETDIACIRDGDFYFTADEVMPRIEEKFASLRSILEEYAEDEIVKLIDKYNDAVKTSVSLCVMGLYSAGKSAFINSMIGVEVLPSSSDPTTAKVYRICCDQKYQICFRIDEKEYALNFEGEGYQPNSSLLEELIGELQDIVKPEGPHNEIVHMNRALEIINKYKSSEHKISDVVEVRLPYKNTGLPKDEFDFVIYDTPGSDSGSNTEHFEILKKSLDEQTNALPIFVTAPDYMDKESNKKVLNLIEETEAFDTPNSLVIVNRADEKGDNALREKRQKCNQLSITKWKSTRILFLSSLIGIASKKENPDAPDEWIDKDMFEIYDEKNSKFASDKRKLFEYNIVDESRKEESVKYLDERKATHLYRNSGLESIEKEIAEYARKYDLYNKCQQSSEYLQRAIELCVENVNEAKSELDSTLQKVKSRFDTKEKELCDKLDDKKKDITVYNTDFQKMMEKIFSAYAVENNLSEDRKKYLQTELKNQWRKFKEAEKEQEYYRNWKFEQFQKYVYDKYNGLLDGFSQKANGDIEEFWNHRSDLFKKHCIEIVHKSDALTTEQKKILESIVLSRKRISMVHMAFNLRHKRAIRYKKFLFWDRKSEKIDFKACGNAIVQSFNDEIRKRITETVHANANNFKNWTDNLINTFTEELSKFNPELNSFHQQMEKIRTEMEEKEKCTRILEYSKKYIDELLDVQEGVEIA